MFDWIQHLPEALNLVNWPKLHPIVGTIAAVISILFALYQIIRRFALERKLAEKQKKLDAIEKAADSIDTNLWELWSKSAPEWLREKWAKSKLRVLLLANFKGGVGKTTTAANLAIALARRGYRVLIIDFDYQGSLDSRFQANVKNNTKTGGSNALLMKEGRLFDIATMYELTDIYKGITLVPSYFWLAPLENRLMLQWLLQSQTDDIRFRLADKLLDDRVERDYEVVIIDTPPRLTAGTVNALCISTDVIIPTIVDPTSIEAVQGFAQTVQTFLQYNHKLKIHGVIPSLTSQAILKPVEKQMLVELDNELEKLGFGRKVLPMNVPRKTLQAVMTGDKALYDADEGCKRVFDELADSLHLPEPVSLSSTKEAKYESLGISVSA